MLLADWPEPLQPASAEGLPSAEDLDLTEALRAAVADLPAGQRQAVELYCYADLPASQIGESPGAAKASLHKARRRLREYITAHRPDLIPVAARRTSMITVRIAHAQPQLDQRADTAVAPGPVLVVLADDAGRPAMPSGALSTAFLGQAFAADGYRGATVTFGAEVHAEEMADHAELWLPIVRQDCSRSLEEYGPAITDRRVMVPFYQRPGTLERPMASRY